VVEMMWSELMDGETKLEKDTKIPRSTHMFMFLKTTTSELLLQLVVLNTGDESGKIHPVYNIEITARKGRTRVDIKPR